MIKNEIYNECISVLSGEPIAREDFALNEWIQLAQWSDLLIYDLLIIGKDRTTRIPVKKILMAWRGMAYT